MINSNEANNKNKIFYFKKHIKILIGILLFFTIYFVCSFLKKTFDINLFHYIYPVNLARYITFIYIIVMTSFSFYKVIKCVYITHKAPENAFLGSIVFFFDSKSAPTSSKNKWKFFIGTVIYSLYYLSLWSFCIFAFILDLRKIDGITNPYINIFLGFSFIAATIAFFATFIHAIVTTVSPLKSQKKKKLNTLPSPMAFDINIFKSRRKFRYILIKIILISPALLVCIHIQNFFMGYSFLPYEKSFILLYIAFMIFFFGWILVLPVIYSTIVYEKNNYIRQEIFLEPSLIVRQLDISEGKKSLHLNKLIEYNVISISSYNVKPKYIYIYGTINVYFKVCSLMNLSVSCYILTIILFHFLLLSASKMDLCT